VEHWRQLYIDVTAPESLNDLKFMEDFCKWVNTEQPISLAINAKEGDYSIAGVRRFPG